MQKIHIFLGYLLLLNGLFIPANCYGCKTETNNILCFLFQNIQKTVKRDDAPGIETLPKTLQGKARYYDAEKQSHDTMHNIPFTRSNYQTNNFKANLTKSKKIYYKSSKRPNYTVSQPPLLQKGNLKRQIDKQVPDRGKIYFEDGTHSFSKHLKSSELPMSHSDFTSDSAKLLLEGNGAPYDAYTNAKGIKISKTPMLRIGNFNRNIEKGQSINNTIHFEIGKHPTETKNNASIQLYHHVRIKREEKPIPAHYDVDKVPSKIENAEEEPGETQCNYNLCVEICKTIYFVIPIHLAQCYNNRCFCFPKEDLYPKVIKDVMKNHKLFGIQQTYE